MCICCGGFGFNLFAEKAGTRERGNIALWVVLHFDLQSQELWAIFKQSYRTICLQQSIWDSLLVSSLNYRDLSGIFMFMGFSLVSHSSFALCCLQLYIQRWIFRILAIEYSISCGFSFFFFLFSFFHLKKNSLDFYTLNPKICGYIYIFFFTEFCLVFRRK